MNMMKKLLLFVSIALLSQTADAQVQQARWWYFGSGAGLDFNTAPSADPNGTYKLMKAVLQFPLRLAHCIFTLTGVL